MLTRPEVYEQIANEYIGNYEVEVYENYSGRAMYGRTVTGIVTNMPAPMLGYLITIIAQDMNENAYMLDLIPTSYDSMGLSTIYY